MCHLASPYASRIGRPGQETKSRKRRKKRRNCISEPEVCQYGSPRPGGLPGLVYVAESSWRVAHSSPVLA
jgi:hypothetical protein